MVRDRLISWAHLHQALRLQRRVNMQLGELLVSMGALPAHGLLPALARQHNAQQIDLKRTPPRANMADSVPVSICLKRRVVPWMRIDQTLLIATARPDQFDIVKADLAALGMTALPVIAEPSDINAQICRLYARELKTKAVSSVPAPESCRNWGQNGTRRGIWAMLIGLLLGAALFLAPHWTMTLIFLWCLFTLVLTVGLKCAALASQLQDYRPALAPLQTGEISPFRLPRVSVMVPLFHETEIASALIKRLERLTYPKSMLEVVLVLEAQDEMTQQTIARTALPDWISVITVPDDGRVTTKPRALNYALNFCQGSIIGVWDAEDAPEPDQIEKVVMRFAQAPKEVACLQGMLDYYNPRMNWIARCFTIEYASWWRVVMPGMARLGLVLPLGGTTLFFKRDVLEKLGAWDAYNVTEDADLGVRLARHGYRTELLETVTYEEANCRPWRWVRQRSRWLKGFLITYLVHMRQPRKLVRELGWGRVLGLQIIFLATFTQFAAAPWLWSIWLVSFGLSHPLSVTLGSGFLVGLSVFFIACELLHLVIHLRAVWAPERRHLLLWTLTMPIYFLLGALAAYKALYELISQPFYWDKTQHGYEPETQAASAVPSIAPNSLPSQT